MRENQYWLWTAMSYDGAFWVGIAIKSLGYWCAANTPLLTGLLTAFVFRNNRKRSWLMIPLIPILTYALLFIPGLIYDILNDLLSLALLILYQSSFEEIEKIEFLRNYEMLTDNIWSTAIGWLWQHWTYALPALLTPLSIAVSVFVVRRWEALEVVLRFPLKNTPAPDVSHEI